ncbi:MAG: hypothetical protein IJX78_00910 [Bacilli bacterium]|nr:hypothetical protein [Bacilli bacterium]
MQVFFAVINEFEYMPKILKKLAEAHFHGTVLHSTSIKHELLNSIEPAPEFGSLSKLTSYEPSNKPTLFVVVKDDQEVEELRSIINKVTGGIKGKGFMFTMPVNYVEGLED